MRKKYVIFFENSGSRAKVRAAGWCEPRKTGASLRAFGFGPGSMPSLNCVAKVSRDAITFSEVPGRAPRPRHPRRDLAYDAPQGKEPPPQELDLLAHFARALRTPNSAAGVGHKMVGAGVHYELSALISYVPLTSSCRTPTSDWDLAGLEQPPKAAWRPPHRQPPRRP